MQACWPSIANPHNAILSAQNALKLVIILAATYAEDGISDALSISNPPGRQPCHVLRVAVTALFTTTSSKLVKQPMQISTVDGRPTLYPQLWRQWHCLLKDTGNPLHFDSTHWTDRRYFTSVSSLARRTVWWPELNAGISSLVSNCTRCQEAIGQALQLDSMPTYPYARTRMNKVSDMPYMLN